VHYHENKVIDGWLELHHPVLPPENFGRSSVIWLGDVANGMERVKEF
jgi:hypothetical protein